MEFSHCYSCPVMSRNVFHEMSVTHNIIICFFDVLTKIQSSFVIKD